MTYSFHPEAEREFVRAIDYYEERRQELGMSFPKRYIRRYSASVPFLNYGRLSMKKFDAP
ncbi:MAG: hypothetical protein U5K69_14640 [Balneolaceae bacterium]|nr:hypothetical protein [Balneolaceae bacterium]